MQKIGKLNPALDIIPLQESSNNSRMKSMEAREKGESAPYKYRRDPLLISRVQAYLHENENKVYIDVSEVADYLQRKYRDYRGKKRGPFRAMVRTAYDELTDLFAKKPNDEWPYLDDDEDEVDIESDSQNVGLSDTLLNMYKRQYTRQNGNSSDKELINISSDDETCQEDSKITEDLKADHNEQDAKNVEKDPLRIEKSVKIAEEPQEKSTMTQTEQRKTDLPTQPTESRNPPGKKRLRNKQNDNVQPPIMKRQKSTPIVDLKVKFSDVGGSDKVLSTVCKLLVHMKHPEVFKQLGISPPRGFLLHGPPGCGKTLLAHAIAGELEVPLFKVAAPELVAGVSGESEARIRELFDQAVAIAPSVLFLDEIDAIAPHRAAAQREMERRIVAQLLSCLDGLGSQENGDRVLVLGATNRPDSLDPALRRAGRFDREISLGIPNKEARAKILAVHTSKVALSPSVDLNTIASLSPGYVGADLVALIREAAMVAIDRVFESLNKTVQQNPNAIMEKDIEITNAENEVHKKAQTSGHPDGIVSDTGSVESSTSQKAAISVTTDQQIPSEVLMISDVTDNPKPSDPLSLFTWLRNEPPLSAECLSRLCIEPSDFEIALRMVQPSAKREGFATVPDVTWDDIGSLQDIRQELQMAILAPIRHAEHFDTLGLTAATGLLLCGPPGCGKTLLAKAIANEAGINFISVKGPELLNMYVGESEKAVRQCFMRARNSAPCVIFFDELDALCPKRSSEGDNSASSRVVNQMLTEMDGVEGRQGVFLMAASNRPDIIDPAVLRPGRLDKILYVGLPTASDRVDILRALTKNGTKPKLAEDVSLQEIGNNVKCEGYTGADLASLVREAGMIALKELMENPTNRVEISMRHIVAAFDKIRPSVHEKDIKHYEKLRKLYSVSKTEDVTPMETPFESPVIDVVGPMEAMET